MACVLYVVPEGEREGRHVGVCARFLLTICRSHKPYAIILSIVSDYVVLLEENVKRISKISNGKMR